MTSIILPQEIGSKISFSCSKNVLAHYIQCMSKESKESKENKENKDKDMLVRVQPTLFEKFKDKCEANYKSISEVIRDFMQQYIKEDK